MSTPLTVGPIPTVAITKNVKRADVRFQNVGETTLYFYRAPGIPSSTNYEFVLYPGNIDESENGNSDKNDDDNGNGNPTPPPFQKVGITTIITDSTKQFNVVSSGNNGKLAIYETINVNTF